MPRLFTAPKFALIEHHPELEPLREAVTERRWPEAADRLDALDDATVAVRMIAEIASVEKPLTEAATTGQGAHWTPIMLTARLLRLGRRTLVPSGFRATKRSRLDLSDERFSSVESLIDHVASDVPDNVVAATLRLQSGIACGRDGDEIRRRFDAAGAARPDPIWAQLMMFRYLISTDELDYSELQAFVHAAMGAAPLGSLHGALVADAHIRAWAALGGSDRDAYIDQYPVAHELREASIRSVTHPRFDHTRLGWVWAHNTFALAWTIAGEPGSARPHFEALDMRASRDPWNIYPQPGSAYLAARTGALGWFR